MAERNPLFDDLAKVASSAMSTFGGLRDEAQAALRARMEDMLADMDLVTRDEFEAVRAMALKAREENQKLLEEIEALKAKAAPKAPARKPIAKAATTTKTKAASQAKASQKKAPAAKTTPKSSKT